MKEKKTETEVEVKTEKKVETETKTKKTQISINFRKYLPTILATLCFLAAIIYDVEVSQSIVSISKAFIPLLVVILPLLSFVFNFYLQKDSNHEKIGIVLIFLGVIIFACFLLACISVGINPLAISAPLLSTDQDFKKIFVYILVYLFTLLLFELLFIYNSLIKNCNELSEVFSEKNRRRKNLMIIYMTCASCLLLVINFLIKGDFIVSSTLSILLASVYAFIHFLHYDSFF